jgi:hypothetical protein
MEQRYDFMLRGIDEIKPETLVEVGVFRGERSREMIRRALKHRDSVRFFGFDLFEDMTEQLKEKEVSRSLMPSKMNELLKELKEEFPKAEIFLIKGDTKQTLPVMDIPIDFAFIDGGHSYDTARSDLKEVLRMINYDSLVFVDDYSEQSKNIFTKKVVDEVSSNYLVEISGEVDSASPSYGSVDLRMARISCR